MLFNTEIVIEPLNIVYLCFIIIKRNIENCLLVLRIYMFRLSFLFLSTFFFCLIGLILSNAESLEASVGEVYDEPLVTLSLTGKPLEEALKEVSALTGYKILIEKDFQSIPVSGMYKDVSVEEFIRRALRGKNLSVISDENKKIIIVRLFGKKSGIDNLVLITDVEDGPGSTLTSDELSDIKRLHSKQKADYERWQKDPEAVDPYTGAKLGDISELHQNQVEEYSEWKNNPESLDPYSGEKLGDIRTLHESQAQEYDDWKNNPESIEPESGEKIGNIKVLHEEQTTSYNKWKNNPDSIDPYSGARLGELKSLHEQQEKEMAAKWGRK